MTIHDEHLRRVLDNRDCDVRPQDDLFRHVNGGWLATAEIPEDLASFGSFLGLHLQAEADVHEIVEELVAGSGPAGESQGAEAKLVADLYSSWMDTETANAKGTAPLAPDLELIDGASTKADLARAVGALQRTGVGSFFGLDVDTDINDPDRYTTFVFQSGLGLPDEAYYRDEQFAPILAAYREFVPGFLALVYELDEDEAARQAQVVLDLETRIAATHMSRVDARDTDKTNNPMSFADFAARSEGFDWHGATTAAGFTAGKLESVIVLNPEALAGSAAIWAESSLEDLKTYQRWRLARARSSYLTEEIDQASFEFYGKVLAGTQVQRERWKRGVALVNSSLGQAVGTLYAERHFPLAHREATMNLVEDLLEAYRRSIRELPWMGEDTRAKALEKVDSFATKIGFPDKWKDYSALSTGSDLVQNIRAVEAFEYDRSIAKLGAEMDRSEWFMNPQTVNAYYNPAWNEIVFPAGILQFPFFDPERDAALNYGGIGAVIGHEIGHGFDDQGSKYDATGALHNWWTDEDRAAFEERTEALIAQYDAYCPAQFAGDEDAPHVQGALTIGENIGDLGGLSIGIKAYEIHLEREGLTLDEAPVIDGTTGLQRVLYSYARVWREKRRDEFMRMLLGTDPHSPSEFRCNGVVKNVDAFAEAFDVREGDGLWLDPAERVRIW